MRKRKFIYIASVLALAMSFALFTPQPVYAVTDYDGNGIITKDEKQKYYIEVWGVDPYVPGGAEQLQKAMNEHAQKHNSNNPTPAPAPTQEPQKKEEKHEHKYTAKVTKEATCTEEGEMTYTCKCGDSYTEAIPKKAHEYEVTVTKEPTCTEEGMETKVCKICGDTIETPIPALGHKAGEWVTEKEPTCSEEGRSVRYCTVCGEPVETMMIDKLPHTEGKWEVVKKPTLTKPGLRVVKCTVCGEVLKEEEIPANTALLYILIGVGAAVLVAAGVLLYKKRR